MSWRRAAYALDVRHSGEPEAGRFSANIVAAGWGRAAVLARRLTSLVILAAFVGLAVLSFLGDRALATVFIVVAGGVLAHHAVSLCPRCSNRACAFNPRFREHSDRRDLDSLPYSRLKINRTTVIPLLATGPLAVIAAWRYSPYWTVAVGAVALAAHSTFREVTCKYCGNDCVGNCNPSFRGGRSAI